MPLHRPVAGPSKAVPPPIPHATRPKTPPPAPPAQAAVVEKSKPKSTALKSAMPGPSNVRAQQAPAEGPRTSTAQAAALKLTPQQPPHPAPSTSTARPAPSAAVKKATAINAPKTKVVPKNASRPTAARREGPPMDQMAKLTMSEKGDREDVVRVSRPARRLASLEDMDVDDPSRGSKRKRDSSRESEFVVSDGQAEDEEKPLRRRAARRADAGKKRTAKRAGTFRDPPCTLCARLGCPCEDQLHQLSYKSACCACHEAKHACTVVLKNIACT